MKRFLLFSIVAFAGLLFAEEKPLKEFPPGTYLGEGKYLTSAGQEGRYSSFAEVLYDQWTAAYLRDGKLMTYTAQFDFSDDSFFNVDVTQVDSSGNETLHSGFGYCIGNSCHLSAFLEHGLLEETVRFAADSSYIDRLGSLIYTDESGTFQTIIWEERMFRFSNNIDSDDEQ